MINQEKFDRSFNRARVAIFVIWFFVIAFAVALVVGFIWGGVKLYTAIEERGMKNVIERVWEGPK